MSRVGPEMRISVDERRSQLRNREVAEERLAQRIERPRKKTKPTRGSKRRRVDAKKRRSDTKRQRQKPTRNDW